MHGGGGRKEREHKQLELDMSINSALPSASTTAPPQLACQSPWLPGSEEYHCNFSPPSHPIPYKEIKLTKPWGDKRILVISWNKKILGMRTVEWSKISRLTPKTHLKKTKFLTLMSTTWWAGFPFFVPVPNFPNFQIYSYILFIIKEYLGSNH